MDDKKITADELELALQGEFKRLVSEVAEALNLAQPGRIIADSEEPVRDASAVFRQRLYQAGLDLLQNKQEAFPPSGQSDQPATSEQRVQNDQPLDD
ncbi:MAG: hypothetical protein QF497_12170 [Verrucomicrobiota bacterium]|jgi:hypothetical protein|nr:hypothetical protein [Phycisphaerae bacterium]MDP7292972.1 hypothetical protein [Verrucomicrobiota bacterium]|tara:strand:+ start:125 stop:415 length:291 start_codon:yes stop_codon:yes gene_type:complete